MTSSYDRPLEGKVALVTGAGRNTGRAIALAYADAGADVVVNVRTDRGEAEAVVKEIEARGRRAIAVAADVASLDAVEQMVGEARRSLGPVTILACSAAARSLTTIREMSPEEWDRVVRVTLYGTFHCVKATVEDMVDAGFGRIVALTADGAHEGLPGHSHVAASKFGVEGMMRSLCRELGPFGITANVISPSGMNTERRSTPEHSKKLEELRAAMGSSSSRSPLGRLPTVEEIADLCVYLSLPSTAFISGQTVHANGGTYFGY
jgi:3-oxoacyl-[acyl-carrier protein] reductase